MKTLRFPRAVLALTLILTAQAAAPAPSRAGLTEENFFNMGVADACALDGNLAVIGHGAGLDFYAMFGPVPFQIGTVAARGVVGDIVLRGNIAFISTWDGHVQSFDISDPSNARALDDTYVDFVITDIELVGDWLVGSSPASGEIWRMDATRPEDLRVTDRISGTSVQAITADGDDDAWLGTGFAAQQLHMEPFEVGAQTFLSGARQVHAVGSDHLLIGANIYDRATFSVVVTLPAPDGVRHAHLEDHVAILLDGQNTLHRFDLKDPTAPELKDSQPINRFDGFSTTIAASGDQVIVTSGGAESVDYRGTTPKARVLIRKLDLRGLAVWKRGLLGAVAEGGLLYLSLVDRALPAPLSVSWAEALVLDMVAGACPLAARLPGDLHRIPGAPEHVARPALPIYAAAGPDGLIVLEHDGRGSLEEIRRLPFGNAVAVHRDDDRLFVTDDSQGIHILDLSDPWNPAPIGVFTTTFATNCTTVGDVLYVANQTPTNLVVDISDPTTPVQLGTFPGTFYLAVDGDRLYAPSTWEFRIFDITDPTTPVEIGFNTDYIFMQAITPVPAAQTPPGERHAWVARGFDGVELVDFTDPNAPVRLERYATRDLAMDVVVGDGFLAVADGLAGLAILKRTPTARAGSGGTIGALPNAQPGLDMTTLELENRPNPVRESTEFRFTLPAAGSVRLDLFDVAGRRISTIVDRALAAGSHSIGWDARDEAGRQVAAGAYLYRLTTSRGTATSKLMVVR